MVIKVFIFLRFVDAPLRFSAFPIEWFKVGENHVPLFTVVCCRKQFLYFPPLWHKVKMWPCTSSPLKYKCVKSVLLWHLSNISLDQCGKPPHEGPNLSVLFKRFPTWAVPITSFSSPYWGFAHLWGSWKFLTSIQKDVHDYQGVSWWNS